MGKSIGKTLIDEKENFASENKEFIYCIFEKERSDVCYINNFIIVDLFMETDNKISRRKNINIRRSNVPFSQDVDFLCNRLIVGLEMLKIRIKKIIKISVKLIENLLFYGFIAKLLKNIDFSVIIKLGIKNKLDNGVIRA